jgi:hypothetical protein
VNELGVVGKKCRFDALVGRADGQVVVELMRAVSASCPADFPEPERAHGQRRQPKREDTG